MAEKKVIGWFTVNGKHIPVFEGESKSDAFKRQFKDGRENQPVTEKHVKKLEKDYLDNNRKQWAASREGKSAKTDEEVLKAMGKSIDYQRKTDEAKHKLNNTLYNHPVMKSYKVNGRKKSVAEQNEDIKQKQISQAKEQANKAKGYYFSKDEAAFIKDEIKDATSRIPANGKFDGEMLMKDNNTAEHIKAFTKQFGGDSTQIYNAIRDKIDDMAGNKTHAEDNAKALGLDYNKIGDKTAKEYAEKYAEYQKLKENGGNPNKMSELKSWLNSHRKFVEEYNAKQKSLENDKNTKFDDYYDFIYQNSHLSKEEAKKVATDSWNKGLSKLQALASADKAKGDDKDPDTGLYKSTRAMMDNMSDDKLRSNLVSIRKMLKDQNLSPEQRTKWEKTANMIESKLNRTTLGFKTDANVDVAHNSSFRETLMDLKNPNNIKGSIRIAETLSPEDRKQFISDFKAYLKDKHPDLDYSVSISDSKKDGGVWLKLKNNNIDKYGNKKSFDISKASGSAVRKNLEGALQSVVDKDGGKGEYWKHISPLSSKLDYGFDQSDLVSLGNIFAKGNPKINAAMIELLTDCNFHSEARLLSEALKSPNPKESTAFKKYLDLIKKW